MENNICHFNKAQYRIGEDVYISFPKEWEHVACAVFCLEREIVPVMEIVSNQVILHKIPQGNYGVAVRSGEICWEGAFDVVDTFGRITRYGFLADFSKDEPDESDVEWMRDLHLNAVQFYDWMYRHDELLPVQEEYQDPMGRPTSLRTIRDKIASCHRMGIRSFAYGAVYAATEATFRLHPQWAMYTMDGQPMLFGEWLYYMNISTDCEWADYLIDQYRKALQFGFDGIHMDTYGFPKCVWDCNGNIVDLSVEFPKLIERTARMARQEGGDKGVIFNAVNNWPVESVDDTDQDTVYIEVWPPNDSYYDLYTLIREVGLRSGRRVTLAAYMKPFQEQDKKAAMRALRLCWAAICASGGTQLVFGEKHAVLQDSYYVHYGHLQSDMLPVVQRYCDFLVRYADLLYDDKGIDISRTAAGGINKDVCFAGENCDFSVDGRGGTVWTIIRSSTARLTVQMINLRGNDALWDVGKKEPVPAQNLQMQLRLDRSVYGIYCASPDCPYLSAVRLSYRYEESNEGRIYTVEIPSLLYWCIVWVEMEE